jgi:hypothetical protein
MPAQQYDLLDEIDKVMYHYSQASQLSTEVVDAVIKEIGHAMLSVIGSSYQMGHRTLRGHLVYQHADRDQPHTPSGELIRWLKYISSFGKEARDQVGIPPRLVGFAQWYSTDCFSKALEETK